MNQWQGKKWYCYGTSMTDNSVSEGITGRKPDGTRNSGRTGFYAEKLAELSGLEEHNFGKAGSGIVPKFHGDDNIKTRCMNLTDGKAEADLITVEVIPNDLMKAELGDVTDLSDDTFCGNLNQIIEYLLTNTNATVVILLASRSRYKPDNISEKWSPESDLVKEWMKWEDAVTTICRMHGIQCWNGASEAGLGYFRIAKDCSLLQDQIHLTEKGGEVLAKYYWGKLGNIFPNKKV